MEKNMAKKVRMGRIEKLVMSTPKHFRHFGKKRKRYIQEEPVKHKPIETHYWKKLNYNSYAEYLQSPLWAEIRKSVLERFNYKCRCGKKATEVHHKYYSPKNITGQTFDGLEAVCRSCHSRKHT